MNNNYPTNADPRPKRRRSKDNPYELYTIGMDTEHPRYFVEFADGQNRKHCEEISKELYELLDSFELEDLSYMNECDRHRIKVSLSDVLIHQCAAEPVEPLQELIEMADDKERLHKAISMLSSVQQRRIQMYYFADMTYEEIAEAEQCSFQAVEKTLRKARKTIMNILKMFP
ncbi:MAG: sigma-70 family RNA polymerase sigma factor [Clostridia bacterium]|nr:sigma-70 family RNA polymerase sigma factor [Clostridia bacterium]